MYKRLQAQDAAAPATVRHHWPGLQQGEPAHLARQGSNEPEQGTQQRAAAPAQPPSQEVSSSGSAAWLLDESCADVLSHAGAGQAALRCRGQHVRADARGAERDAEERLGVLARLPAAQAAACPHG